MECPIKDVKLYAMGNIVSTENVVKPFKKMFLKRKI